jgi:hypothetical protein
MHPISNSLSAISGSFKQQIVPLSPKRRSFTLRGATTVWAEAKRADTAAGLFRLTLNKGTTHLGFAQVNSITRITLPQPYKYSFSQLHFYKYFKKACRNPALSFYFWDITLA